MPTAVPSSATVRSRPQLWRVTDRATFQALRASGRRSRSGPLTVTWLAPEDAASPPRAGYTVSRAAGGAVVRNRIRRRLRAALRDLHTAQRLPAGSYLIAGTAEVARMPWPALLAHLERAVSEAQQ